MDKQYKSIVQQMGDMQVTNLALVNSTSKQMEVRHQQLTESVNSQLVTLQQHVKKIQDDIAVRLAEPNVSSGNSGNPSKGNGRWGGAASSIRANSAPSKDDRDGFIRAAAVSEFSDILVGGLPEGTMNEEMNPFLEHLCKAEVGVELTPLPAPFRGQCGRLRVGSHSDRKLAIEGLRALDISFNGKSGSCKPYFKVFEPADQRAKNAEIRWLHSHLYGILKGHITRLVLDSDKRNSVLYMNNIVVARFVCIDEPTQIVRGMIDRKKHVFTILKQQMEDALKSLGARASVEQISKSFSDRRV